ncbi:MAG: site-specific DNA-methyltransferase [Coriobacteriia bacterium]|nr:site-specific DNA-methyltransferase [Coriobacteriia bacterium]
MEKINPATTDLTQENLAKIAELFPDVITEAMNDNGELVKAVDFDALKENLSSNVVEGKRERYQFTWPGKAEAKLEARKPIDKTLRPCPKESVDWDTTENLYIEGNNLEALKLLRDSYAGEVKLVYIDPPYNTGNNFIYDDDFSESTTNHVERSGEFDEEGGRLVSNPESNGRFHSDWCSMMYPRLTLAKDLLINSGAIFISIDDHEVTNLTKIMDEIFGSANRIALVCHKARASISNDKIISPNHNTVLFYAKDISVLELNRKQIGLDPTLDGFDYDDNNGRGPYRFVPVDGPGGAKKGNPYFEFLGVEGYWRFSRETMQLKYNDGFVVRRGDSLYQKYYRHDAEKTRKTVTTWWDDAGLTSNATARLKKLMGGAAFDTPKPLELIDRMLKMMTFDDPSAIVLDFFAGSGTTGESVMRTNAEYGGKRRFVLVQLAEQINEKSDALSLGYSNLAEVAAERLRRSGRQIKIDYLEENERLEFGDATCKSSCPDVGFRVLKIDSSNYTETYQPPEMVTQGALAMFADNLKADRSNLDLLFQVLPKFRIPYSAKVQAVDIAGKSVFNVNDGQLLACFDVNVGVDTIEAIAKQKPVYAVFRDASMADDSTEANFEELFKTFSPDTIRRVI